MSMRLAIPPEEKRYLDSLRLTREDMDEAWARGWNYARHVIIQAILDMPPLYPDVAPADVQDGGPTDEQMEDELANVNR